jgi:ABC-type nitrate/sulfonate/bicarbonate transport system substrate-binding protein
MDAVDQKVQVIRDGQGWSDETLGALAMNFISADPDLTERFIARLREIAAEENESAEG